MRPLNLVMDATLKLVPEDFASRTELTERFEYIKDSIHYTAPEAMYLRWEDFTNVLSTYIPEPTLDWQKNIQSLVGGFLDYREILNA